MSFTKALYYPSIEIDNDNWLKSSVLFWDSISTIVPAQFENPYQNNRSSIVLKENGILSPYYIDSISQPVKEIAKDVLKFLDTDEGRNLLFESGTDGTEKSKIHSAKFPGEILELVVEKSNPNKWISVDREFANFYMTILANKICDSGRFVLLTDDNLSSNLSDVTRVDVKRTPRWQNYVVYGESVNTPISIAQGMLSTLILDGIRFKDSVKIEKIIEFKEKYKDELGAFRMNLNKLTKDFSKYPDINAMRNELNDTYTNEFLPSYNSFKKALSGFNLQWTTENIMKISFFSTSGTAIPTLLLGASTQLALLAGVGISLVSSLVSYNENRKKMLRENPYSFLYLMEKKFSDK